MVNETQKSQHYKYIIIGQGLAGSLLAWSLLQMGASVCLISEQKDCASRVAAGLINPVTGQRFVLAELTPQMLEWGKHFYQDIEDKLQVKVYHEQAMLRLFNNEKERFNGEKRLMQDNYLPFLTLMDIPDHISAEHSGLAQQQTAWLDTNLLLDSLATHFDQHPDVLFSQHQHFNHRDIRSTVDSVQWQSVSADKVIFCEGYKLKDNPLFSWLPLQPVHGEILTCKTSASLDKDIINKNKWLLPTDNHHCKIGATYEPSIHEPQLQETSKQDLLDFANHLFKEKYDFHCLEHQAGIRPATKDKQPFLGFHPEHENIGVFNGFGSRGSLMIPYYANLFSESLLQGLKIPKEVDTKRFESLYS